MIEFYPTFTNLCKNSLENGYKMELSAITNAKLAIYSSEWAAETARVIYQADKSKVKVVPFGAQRL
jgi:hypothetical protein